MTTLFLDALKFMGPVSIGVQVGCMIKHILVGSKKALFRQRQPARDIRQTHIVLQHERNTYRITRA